MLDPSLCGETAAELVTHHDGATAGICVERARLVMIANLPHDFLPDAGLADAYGLT